MKANSFSAAIPEIEKRVGYVFRDKSLLMQAFTRTSFCNENSGGYQSNEVLEFFGDGVLSLAIISHLLEKMTVRYEHGIRTDLGEGDFSNIKSKLSDKKNLSECMSALGLAKHLIMGEGDAKMGIESEPSVLEDLFESIIGAVYIDCGMNIRTVMGVAEKMLDLSLYTSTTPPIQSAKNALQEWCDSKLRRLPHPVYTTVSESGPDHKKVYERAVSIGERVVATGKGKNTKLADAEAASAALRILMAEEERRAKTPAADTSKAKTAEQPQKTTAKGDTPAKKSAPAAKPAKGETSIKKPAPAAKPAKSEAPTKKPAPAAKPAKDETSAKKSAPAANPAKGETSAKKSAPAAKPAKGETSAKKSAPAAKPAKGETSAKKSAPAAKPAKDETSIKKSAPAAKPTKSEAPTKKPAPAAKAAEPTTAKNTAKLKVYAKGQKLPSPAFKLLSEVGGGIHRVECRLGGDTAIGTGTTLLAAREDAAGKLLSTVKRRDALGISGRKPEPAPVGTKKTGKKKRG